MEKKTLGRRKIPIKKIEKKSCLQVAFTKRRGGLFRKATELSVLCGLEIAILVKSPAGKLYSFGHPSVDALINRAAPSPAAKRILPYGNDGGLQLHQLEQLPNSLEKKVEENPKNCGPPLSIHQQPSPSSNLISADKFVMDAASPLSLQQLIAADDIVIETDIFCDEEEAQLASSIDYQNYYHILGA
ncbi:agamous-like MADS-box protein AGL28 [Salvia splendens]|uniref:agamous-like MADS-box protein AGL28 n=1 Tax=Salvia splendens TaxID=180675 RepID=UPI001C26D418|nr:agamous-like MADS-box protein AGL28 [Salvia splendens]